MSVRVPAITPDARRHSKATSSHPEPTAPDAHTQYASYRNGIFPSYDRLRFVRLPTDRIPEGISGIASVNDLKLEWWPALVYRNLGELVRDLPSDSKLAKAKLILEHRRSPSQAVARLIGWRNLAMGGLSGPSTKVAPIFPEEKMELIRLSGNTVVEDEGTGIGNGNEQLLSFLDYQFDFEEVCDDILHKSMPMKKSSMVLHYAVQFRRAFDMALNCLAMDIDADVLPIRNESSLLCPKNRVHEGENIKKESQPKSQTKKQKPQKAEESGPSVAQKKEKGEACLDAKREKKSRRVSTEESSKVKKETFNAGQHAKKIKSESSKTILPNSTGTTSKKDKNNIAQASSSQPTEETWDEVWKSMRKMGWKWKAGSGLVDYYYIKPETSNIRDGVEGKDYFVNEEDVQKYAMENLGWVNGASLAPATKMSECKEKIRKISKSNHSAAPMTEDKASVEKENHKKNRTESKHEENTYSRPFLPPKRLFANDSGTSLQVDPNEVVPPLIGDKIEPNELWRDAWEKMLKSGWSWKSGSGLMMDYFYIKPDCKIKTGTEGRDYFKTLEDVQQFAKRNYGWVGGPSQLKTTAGKKRSSSGSESVKKQKQEKRAKVDKTEVTNHTATPKKDPKKQTCAPDVYRWEVLWPTLQSAGWKVIKAGKYNKLHDWYYIRPNCDPGDESSQLGHHYFASPSDVIQFVKKIHDIKDRKTEVLQSDAKKTPSAKRASQSKKKFSNQLECPRTPDDVCKTKPQDPAAPLPTPSTTGSTSSSNSNDRYDWTNLWPKLQTYGWQVIKAGKYNKLHDWYYIRPNCDPGDESSQLGRHYFASPSDVIQFVRNMDDDDSNCQGERRTKHLF